MSERVCTGRWVAVSRIALVGLIGGLASACSTETMRFADTSFSNPFASSERVAANQPQSAPQAPAPVAAVPTARIQSQALPPIQSQALAQPLAPAQAQPSRVASAPVTSNGTGGWTASGGTAVTVGSGDSVNTLSQRYGVPAPAILSANGLSNANQVAPGRQIVIPVYHANGQPAQVASARPAAPVAPAQPAGQTKFRLVEGAKPADPANAPRTHVRPGMVTTAQKAPAAVSPAPAQAAALKPAAVPQKVAARVEPQPVKPVAAAPVAQPVRTAAVQPAAPAPQPEVAKAPVKEPEQTASLSGPSSEFRWPARGRVIAGFGANGGNEGINIAVPEGTPVKAAEAGVVTYAGSEVKGYGNLVLIRHENGYVSAYAHNGELGVKRGEQVKRGQVIAKSGQTGNVTSPQLHFEIRKGQQPVDPVAHLSGT
jgi:murein DD-endopeptidase MepM/ murein hydrolase activator NlpD